MSLRYQISNIYVMFTAIICKAITGGRFGWEFRIPHAILWSLTMHFGINYRNKCVYVKLYIIGDIFEVEVMTLCGQPLYASHIITNEAHIPTIVYVDMF